MAIKIISDVKGNSKLLNKIIGDGSKTSIDDFYIFGGDYIDGGLNSLETLQLIKSIVDSGKGLAVRGNHEDLMIDFLSKNFDVEELSEALNKNLEDVYNETLLHMLEELRESDTLTNGYKNELLMIWEDNHILNGGLATYNSFLQTNYVLNELTIFDVEEIAEQMVEDWEELIVWVSNLPDIVELENIVVVHAGLDNSLGEDWRKSNNFWKKWATTDYVYDKRNVTGKTLVTGHYPTKNISLNNEESAVVNLGNNKYAIDGDVLETYSLNVLSLNEDGSFISANKVK